MERVSEAIPIPENETEVVIPLTSFAVSVREVEPDEMEGLTFSALFGNSFDFSNNEDKINTSSLVFEEHQQATASITVPNDLFRDLTPLIDERNMSTPRRIINTVYLTDSLFTPRVETSLRVGSIIVSAAISGGVTVENLSTPIMLQFLKSPVSYARKIG